MMFLMRKLNANHKRFMAKYSADLPLVIIPSATRSQYCRLLQVCADSQPRLLPGQLPFPFLSYSTNRGHAASTHWIVGVRPGPFGKKVGCDQIVRRRISPTGQLVPLPAIQIPRFQRIKCLLLHGDWLYFGGAYDHTWAGQPSPNQELLCRLNLNAEAPKLEPVPLPVDFGAGKAIDDLLQEDNELLVVDNIVYPKYLFFYQLPTEAQLPQWQRTHQLPFSRVYEHIKRAAWSAQFIALLSNSTGMGGTGRYVSVLRRSDLKPVFVASLYYTRHRLSSTSVNNPDWELNGIDLQGDTLVLACGRRGLAYRLLSATAWPKRRTSYMDWDMTVVDGRWEAGEPRQRRETVLADPLPLETAGPAEGMMWLPVPDGLPPIESVRFVGPGLLLLTGRHTRLGCAATWLQPLPQAAGPLPAVVVLQVANDAATGPRLVLAPVHRTRRAHPLPVA
jgi:hypothetical protein